MKSIQLANLLIKILGIYFAIEAIPSAISWLISGLLALRQPATDTLSTSMGFGIGFCLQAVIALYLIFKSSKIAGFLFKDENE